MTQKNKKAFTLVELIVTIIILAILGTIAFMSFQGYSKSSRNSSRISDINKIKTSLELFAVDSLKYPTPSNSFSVTYTGSTIWTQGSFGDSVFTNIKRLNKKPVDVLSNNELTYSVTENKREYEIGTIVEADGLSNSIINNQTIAANIYAQSYVIGSYNGLVLKAISGTNCSVLTIPTIITTNSTGNIDVNDVINENKLAYKGYSNLPGTFIDSKYTNGSFEFTPNELEVYSDNNSCLSLADEENRLNLYNNIINSYSGTILEGSVISEYNDSSQDITMSKYIVVNKLGIDVNGGDYIPPETPQDPEDPEEPITPIISSYGPSGIITTSPTTLTATTNIGTNCKYDSTNISYDSMTNTFDTTGETSHQTSYTPSSGENSIFVICKDSLEHTTSSVNITFNYEYTQPANIVLYPGDGQTYTCDNCD